MDIQPYLLPTWSDERNIQALRLKVRYPTLEIAILVHVVMSCCPRCRQIRRLSSLEMKQARITYAGAGRWGKVRGEISRGEMSKVGTSPTLLSF